MGVVGFGRHLGSARASRISREEQELVGVELLGLAAVEPAEELFELVLEIVVEVGLLAEGREQLADQPVSGLEVVGKWGVGVDRRHTISTDDDRRCDRESSIEHAKWVTRSSGLRRGQGEPGQPPGAAQVDALEDGGHLGGGDLDAAVPGLGKAERALLEPLDLGITMPSFLCALHEFRAVTLLRATSRRSLFAIVPGRLLGMTNSGCRAAIQEFFRFASCRSRRISSLSAQTIRCFPEGVRREWTQPCLTQ